MGELSQLADRLAPVAEQLVFSSVFETGIGLENSLRLADSLPQNFRPIGFITAKLLLMMGSIICKPRLRLPQIVAHMISTVWSLI